MLRTMDTMGYGGLNRREELEKREGEERSRRIVD